MEGGTNKEGTRGLGEGILYIRRLSIRFPKLSHDWNPRMLFDICRSPQNQEGPEDTFVFGSSDVDLFLFVYSRLRWEPYFCFISNLSLSETKKRIQTVNYGGVG